MSLENKPMASAFLLGSVGGTRWRRHRKAMLARTPPRSDRANCASGARFPNAAIQGTACRTSAARHAGLTRVDGTRGFELIADRPPREPYPRSLSWIRALLRAIGQSTHRPHRGPRWCGYPPPRSGPDAPDICPRSPSTAPAAAPRGPPPPPSPVPPIPPFLPTTP